jgi:protein-disulfide isomerase
MKASQLLFGLVFVSMFVPFSKAQSAPSVSVSVKRADAPEKTSITKSTSTIAAAGAPLATVNGQAITEADLAPLIEGQLRSVRDQEYQIKKKALDTLIAEKVLEAEAKKRELTAEKLVEQEVDSKIPEPTDVEINAVYDVQREQLKQPLQEVKARVAQDLKRARIQQARLEYSTHLRDQAKVAVLLSPQRIQVAIDPARVRGNPKAKVMIVEFSDFQCPYCQRAEATLKGVLAKHGDAVAVSYRDMPLTAIHPMAMGAAQAGRCAGEQGKFWELHDAMFADQAGLDRNGLVAKAKTLNLDEKQFDACLTSEKYKAQVQQDAQEGSRLGINGTPAFFINGVFLNGAQPESAFESVIKDELAAAARP